MTRIRSKLFRIVQKLRIFGVFFALFMRGKARKLTDKQAHERDFSSNTQRLGLRFTDKLRNTFRHRWIKKR